MNKLLKFSAAALMLAAALTSCQEETGQDTLEVSPMSEIAFNATGNEAVVLTVTTTAPAWNAESSDWILTSAEGNTLTVNVKDNAREESRSGSIIFSAGNAKKVLIGVSQSELSEGQVALSVSPMDPVVFTAENTSVTLTIETNASDWAYETPDWVKATKDGKTLTLTATENADGKDRSGFIEISAEGAKTVNIPVSQPYVVDEPVLNDGQPGRLADVTDGTKVELTVSETDGSASAEIVYTLDEPAKEEVKVELFIDTEYLSEYNYLNNTYLEAFPAANVTFSDNGIITIPAGETSGKVYMNIGKVDGVFSGVNYLVPVCVKSVSNTSVTASTKRVNYTYVYYEPGTKAVKNIVYFEVNNTNPLNALEFVLEDGRYFFDVVTLFAANLNYNSVEDVVYLHCNPNVRALLDQTDVYLQPLREKGIKVFLGLLGNHDPAGLCNFSDWGAQQWAQEVADAVKTYKLDGVTLNDEYSQEALYGNRWFIKDKSERYYAGSRLCYELKKAMKETCEWDTYVNVYTYGALSYIEPVKDLETGVEYTPGQYTDILTEYYGSPASPKEGMTLKQCSGVSIECCRHKGYIDSASAEKLKENGYGWVFWFAFDNNPESGIYNWKDNKGMMESAALSFYGSELKEPTGYYKKIDEGVFDPQRYELK